jgi:hypothetical protein
MNLCTDAGNAPSWLVLEQYHLNELPADRQQSVSLHLADCSVCKEHMEYIENYSFPLKPLPAVPDGSLYSRIKDLVAFKTAAWAFAGMTLLMGFVFVYFADNSTAVYSRHMQYKGGDFAMTLVRNRGGAISENPEKYLDGDLFSIQVTCPEAGRVSVDVVVFQGDEIFFPLKSGRITCGNRISLPSGFKLSGQRETTVCVVVGKLPPHYAIISNGMAALPESTVCSTLKPGFR